MLDMKTKIRLIEQAEHLYDGRSRFYDGRTLANMTDELSQATALCDFVYLQCWKKYLRSRNVSPVIPINYWWNWVEGV